MKIRILPKRLDLQLEREQLLQENRKLDRLIRQAHFKVQTTVQSIDYVHARIIKKDMVTQLAPSD